MATTQFKKQLASLNGTWKKAKDKQDEMFGGAMIPEATYMAQLTSAKLVLTKQSQKLAISRTFLILEGDFEGKTLSDLMGLSFNEYSPVYARRWIEQMGYAAPEDLSEELENILDAITKDARYAKIKVKHSGTYYNIDVLEASAATDSDPEGDPADPQIDSNADEEAPETDEASEGDAALTAALLEFATSQDLDGVEVSDEDTLDSLKGKLADFQWQDGELTSEEAELLTKVGLVENIIRPEPLALKKSPTKAVPAKPATAVAKAAPAAKAVTAAPVKPGKAGPKKK